MTSMSLIRVINPNSNATVTRCMSEALEPLRAANGPAIDCVTLEEGPLGIESQANVSEVEPLVARWVQQDNEADAFVIACYSDPGVHLCRELTERPVFGIAECAVLTAMSRGSAFGVISILENSVPRHLRHLRERRLDHLCAGDRPLGLTVAEVASGESTYRRMHEVGSRLRDEDGAEVIIMGCAGMARHRTPLEASLGVPVIDPSQAATCMALGTLAAARA
jgi:Asp/Glu/hydantoin racemase